jgi:hypothetical protein
MMAGCDGPSQIIEVTLTVFAMIPLACGLGLITSALGDFQKLAARTFHSVGPAYLADGCVAFLVVNQLLNAHHSNSMQATDFFIKDLSGEVLTYLPETRNEPPVKSVAFWHHT